jgi:hypothetical protein
MHRLNQYFDQLWYSGVQPEPENQREPGKNLPWTEQLYMLKIHVPNSGVGTAVKRMLSSMNFEERLTSRICYDGSIDIQLVWKLKEDLSHLEPHDTGLPATSTQENGFLSSMAPHI